MRKKPEEYLTGNLCAMIDVVFQLIIFFVCTTQLQDQSKDETIRLALAPHGVVVDKKDPLEITVDVNIKGVISIGRTPLSPDLLTRILKKAVKDSRQPVPVVIRGDFDTRHKSVKDVMDACAKAQIWKIKFAALREKA